MRQIRKMSVSETRDLLLALDLFFRLFLGQYGEIVTHYTGYLYCKADDTELTDSLLRLRKILIPGGDFGGNGLQFSLGIWNQKTASIAERAYDVYQCLRYQMFWYDNPDGSSVHRCVAPLIHSNWCVSSELEQEYLSVIHEQVKDYPKLSWECPICLTFLDGLAELWLDSDEIVKILDKAVWYRTQLCKGKLEDVCLDIIRMQRLEVSYEKVWSLSRKIVQLMDLYRERQLDYEKGGSLSVFVQ